MASSLKIEDVFIQIKSKLQIDGVKLWLPPYYEETTGVNEEELMKLSMEYSQTLNLPYNYCNAALSELQTNALEKLKQRDRFKESGLATIKVKVLKESQSCRLLTKEVSLSSSTADLKNLIASDIDTSPERFKLICNGRVIHDTESLQGQGVKNGNQILALVLRETPSEVRDAETTVKELENVKADTQLLASDDGYYMQLEDQMGNAINVPLNEKKSLITAMTFHEKGKSSLKRQDYAKALVYFLEADREFSCCNSQLLNSVDNYALLDLDIVWCYLCLRSVSHVPEGYQRLKRCEERFNTSYGTDLERVIALKGNTGNEAALFMRLHLLQGIILYHQNNREGALEMLRKAEEEIKVLKVDEDSLMMLVELGYSPAEARLGLRATHGDVNQAANFINENREKRTQSRRKALTEKILNREKKKLGKCSDGQQYVNPEFLKMMVNMGYNREVARVALQQANNVITDSIQYMQDHPLPGPSGTISQEFLGFIEDLIPELEAAGFEYRMAKAALRKHNGDIMAAADDLLTNGGIIDCDLNESDEDKKASKAKDELTKKKEEALLRLSQDISMVDDDHLDLTLQEEEIFLKEYLSLLSQDQ